MRLVISLFYVHFLLLLLTNNFTGANARPSFKRKTDSQKYSSSNINYNSADSNDENNELENSYNYDDTGGGVYDKMDNIIYPFQQYIQVRKSYSVEHLPIQEDKPEYDNYNEPSSSDSRQNYYSSNFNIPSTSRNSKSKSNNSTDKKENMLISASSENNNGNYGNSENNEDHGERHEDGSHDESSSYSRDHKPRLTEEVEDYKKQEVYEEKGYMDGAYDHGGYGQNYNFKGNDDGDNYYDAEESTASEQERSSTTASSQKHLSNEPESTKLLEFAASNLYDKDAHEKGIYAARENIHCPEVIDFDLSSKKMQMGKGGKNPRGSRPRISGLGSKIKCLKEKYFGVEPLPKEIFMEPSESRQSVIKMPSFEQFYKSFKDEFGSEDSFHNF